jgi:hypothetical protein
MRRGSQNIRKFSYMSWVTEGIFKYPKTGEKWLKKFKFHPRTARTVQNAVALSRNADFDVIG